MINHAFSHSPNRLKFKNDLVSHLVGPNKQFGIHEKLSLGMHDELYRPQTFTNVLVYDMKKYISNFFKIKRFSCIL